MDLKNLEYVTDNFCLEKSSKRTNRTKILNGKYVVLVCNGIIKYGATDIIEFVLYPKIKNQKASIVEKHEKELLAYRCGFCDEYVGEEYFVDHYDEIICRKCFESMRDALVVKKENVKSIYIDCLSCIYIMKDDIVVENMHIKIVNTTSLYENLKTNRIMCDYCYSLQKTAELHHYLEKYENRNDICVTVCSKCLKFREYASFMTNYCFVYINEIFITNFLLPELKILIADYMLRVAAY